MSTLVLDYAPPAPSPSRRIIPWTETVVLGGAGIALPMLCFAVSMNRYMGAPQWQRGFLTDHLTLVASGRAGWPFAPLLFAAIFSMGIALISPSRAARSWLLRYSIYSGVILSAQYTLIQMMAIVEPASWFGWGMAGVVAAAVIATGLSAGGIWLSRHFGSIKSNVWLPLVILAIIAAVVFWRLALPMVIFSVMAVAIGAPALSLAAYLRAAILVRRLAHGESQPAAHHRLRLLIGLLWLATYGIAWTIAMMNAVDLYRALPTKPPDC